jgi:hypothetical protein
MRFFEKDGKTWLAISNSDPYLNFGEGSLLLVDIDSIDLAKRKNYLHELTTASLPMDNYVGGLGYIEDRELMLVSSRFSEGAETRDSDDTLWIVDMANPAAPELWQEGSSLTLADDPHPIAIDANGDLAFVLNITDHSISVIDTTETPLSLIDVSPDAYIGPVAFDDTDQSGSRGTAEITLIEPEDLLSDYWTLDWVEGSYRVWVHVDDGLQRYTSGGADYISSALGVELDPNDSIDVDEIVDPYYYVMDGVPSLLFADRGAIRTVSIGYSFDGGIPIGEWDWSSQFPLIWGSVGDWDAHITGPAPMIVDDNPVLYYTGASAEGEASFIGLAVTVGETFDRYAEPVLAPPMGYTSLSQPTLMTDPMTGIYRMWMTMTDDAGHRVIGHSTSLDGTFWEEPTVVLDGETVAFAAPVVIAAGGTYQLWFSQQNGNAWDTVSGWSYDGLSWFDTQVIIEGPEYKKAGVAPRPALQADPTNGWRLTGANQGAIGTVISTGGELLTSFGYSLHVSNGYSVGTGSLDDGAVNGILPTSAIMLNGEETLFATATNAEGRDTIAAFQRGGFDWVAVAQDIIPEGVGGNIGGVRAGVAFENNGTYTLLYSATGSNGNARMYAATSTDGLDYTPSDNILVSPTDFDALVQAPHSVQYADGTIRVWYAGDDGSRQRIGTLVSSDGVLFTRETHNGDDYLVGQGSVGSFDDSSVSSPALWEDENGTQHLYYAGFDGDTWALGHLVRDNDSSPFTATIDPYTEHAFPAMTGTAETFSSASVTNPVLLQDEDVTRFWYGGTDGIAYRIGEGVVTDGQLVPTQNIPTLGDTIEFVTDYGGDVNQVIELAQTVGGFNTSGVGAVSTTLDEARGFLYVTSKLTDYVYVIDIRDDSTASFSDSNYMDIEALVLVTSISGSIGFRDVIVDPHQDRLFLSGRMPDAVVVLDISTLEDNDVKETYTDLQIDALPTKGSLEDLGEGSVAQVGLAGMAIQSEHNVLLVTHYNENALYAFDLDIGVNGTEVGYVSDIGENPHLVRISPDGKHAFVANYIGEIEENTTSSTLAIVDIDPNSESYLEVLTWLVNR